MERKEELQRICKNLEKDVLLLIDPLIEQLAFLEEQLAQLKTLPFIIVKESDKTKQKTTPAYKMYKDLSQSYLNALKVVNGALGIESEQVESPLREYMKLRNEEKKKNA